jgi:hypothetical protein
VVLILYAVVLNHITNAKLEKEERRKREREKNRVKIREDSRASVEERNTRQGNTI